MPFKSNSTDYSVLNVDEYGNIFYDTTKVYDMSTDWVNNNYKTIRTTFHPSQKFTSTDTWLPFYTTNKISLTGPTTITVPTNALTDMFANTGGSFTGTPTINKAYFTDGDIIPNGYDYYTKVPKKSTPSTYTITVSLTNPIGASDFNRCLIEELLSDHKDGAGNYDDYAFQASIDSATGSTTVTISATSFGLQISLDGNWGASYGTSNISTTSNVTFQERTTLGQAIFVATGDGSITFDGVDYED